MIEYDKEAMLNNIIEAQSVRIGKLEKENHRLEKQLELTRKFGRGVVAMGSAIARE